MSHLLQQSRALVRAVALSVLGLLLFAGAARAAPAPVTLLTIDGAIGPASAVGSSRVDLQACKLEYSIVSPK